MKKGNKTRKLLSSILEYVLSIGVFVLAWLIYTTVKDVPLYVLPGPAEVGKSLIGMFADGTVYPHLWATTYEVILGFIIGAMYSSLPQHPTPRLSNLPPPNIKIIVYFCQRTFYLDRYEKHFHRYSRGHHFVVSMW